MFLPLSAILDLIEDAPPASPEICRGYAENAGNAETPSPTPITAFRSFSASGRANPRGTEEPAPVVCYACRGTDFWSGAGTTTCRRCHPPAPGAEVLTPSGPGSDERAPVEIERGARRGGAA